mgnify:CR=1 FL=1
MKKRPSSHLVKLAKRFYKLKGSLDRKLTSDEIKKSIWELSKNRYDNVVVTKNIKDSQAAGDDRKKTITQTIKSYDDANELLLQDITDFVKQGGIGGHQYNQKNAIPGYNYLQNVWQMSGGNGFYDGSAEQDQQLIDNLYEHNYIWTAWCRKGNSVKIYCK